MKKVLISLIIVSMCSFSQWKLYRTSINIPLYSVQFYDTLNGIITGGNGAILKSTDGGKLWLLDLNFIGTYPDFYSISLVGTSGGWITGRFGVTLHTSNAGTTWEQKQFNPGGYYLSHSTFLNDTVGWACGGSNSLFRTKYGGGYWTQEFITNGPESFGYMYTKDCISGYLVGANGAAIKTTNGGFHWTRLNTNTKAKLENITFVNDSVGWTVGSEGTILKTVNSGKDWMPYAFPSKYHFNWISMVDQFTGWIVGSQGIILSTTNSGETWDSVTSVTKATLRCMYFKDKNHGWIVGDSGIVLVYNSSSTMSVSSKSDDLLPLQMQLTQNYPNPFNPTTTIQFTIPQDGEVEISLLDILGRVVQTIVKQYYPLGMYSVVFDATHLSSGSYFYRLKTKEQSITKKMTLIK